MKRPLYSQLIRQAPQRLTQLLSLGKDRMQVRVCNSLSDAGPDLIIESKPVKYAIQCQSSSDAAAIATALHQIKAYAGKLHKTIPLIAVPYMGPVGQRLSAEAGVGWFDLSGNAEIHAPGLRIHVEGKPNAFKSSGRPGSVFAPRSSRIVRWMLMHPKDSFKQQELAQATGVGKGFTSRIIHRLEEMSLVVRDEKGRMRLRDYDAMLEAWREAYDFSKHQIIRGHVAARSSEETLHKLAGSLDRAGITTAATGLGAAWLYTQFAGHRLVTIYVGENPEPALRKEIGFFEEISGENVWLVIPNDEGVFQGARERAGIRCVHPVQAYMDLKDHPERSEEAAARLREDWLKKEP